MRKSFKCGPDSGLESPLGIREGFNFVTKPSTSSFFIAQQTMAVSYIQHDGL